MLGLLGLGSVLTTLTDATMQATRPQVRPALTSDNSVRLEYARVGEHAEARHGTEAIEARAVVQKAVDKNPSLFQQPPCDDGRLRILTGAGAGRWAVWVLEPVAGAWREVTVFFAQQNYVTAVKDKCGQANREWWGHEYAY